MDVDINGAIYEGCEPHGRCFETTAQSSDMGVKAMVRVGSGFTSGLRPALRAARLHFAPTLRAHCLARQRSPSTCLTTRSTA